ncbi:RNA-binding S4 domain-containing protein [Anaerosinus massiliensis]|uniref:RNA-binding S4 domain-containing protein n=1 Tax=Massilibacillus massiliensis TaxID=1806837 RepID=UPI000DA5FE3A|nr:RNA-binding S4 domain-containing protein [Massilibacillus massiliensis]
METIEINSEVIQLDQLLKWAGIVDSGGQVKGMIEEKIIKLNGVFVTERRKKIYPGDTIEILESGIWQVIKSQGE